MSYNDYINNLRLNNSIGYIINNQNIMFDMVTSLRNSINNSNRSRSSRPNYYRKHCFLDSSFLSIKL